MQTTVFNLKVFIKFAHSKLTSDENRACWYLINHFKIQ